MSRLRKLASRVLCKAGLASRLLRPRAGAPVILLYHGVTDDVGHGLINGDGKHVHVDLFGRHLDMLCRSRRVVALEELIGALRNGTEAEGMVAITFDDGYRNNLEHAAPRLVDHKAPATFFIATGFIGTNRWPWTDRLEAAIASAPDGRFDISVLRQHVELSNSPVQRRMVLSRIKALLKTLSWQEAEARSRDIEAELGVTAPDPYGVYRFMSWDDVRHLRRAGFGIGAHTVNHALLSRVCLQDAQREIIESRDRVTAELGSCSPVFCYPNGKRRDYTVEVSGFCRQHFIAALSAEPGAAHPDELYELRRVIVDNATAPEQLASMIVQAA